MANAPSSIFYDETFEEEGNRPRRNKRSLSLDNLHRVSDRKTERVNTLHGFALKNIKRKLGIKISKSNQDGLESIPGVEGRKTGSLHCQLSATNLALDRREKKEDRQKGMPRDLRRRSRTGDSSSGHLSGSVYDHLKCVGVDSTSGRPRSFTESNEGFLTVDNASFDDSLDGHNSPYDTGDDVDGVPPDNERVRHEIERLRRKIEKTKEELQEMQNVKDETVKEYLESTESHVANQKNKMNFEKRNQKTNANIQSLQKKLEKYQRMLREYEEGGASLHGPRGVFRGMHDAVKAGASSASRAVTKPLESFNHFIKKDKKCSSVENVASLIVPSLTSEGSTLQVDDTEKSFLSGASDDDNSSTSSTNQLFGGVQETTTFQSYLTQEDVEVQKLHCQGEQEELRKLRQENEETKERIEKLKDQVDYLAQNLQEERYRSQHLQCQVNDLVNQCNDLTELHQNEILALKQEIERAEERIECVDYRSAERAGEIEEALDSCVTRINKMEVQQQQQQQLLLSVDGYFGGSGTAKMLLSKSLSLVISLFAIVLVIVSTCARIVMPFCTTRVRMLTTFFSITVVVLVWRNTDHGKVKDYAKLIFNSSLPLFERLKVVTRIGNLKGR